jgi:hypothetical protein
MIWLLFRFLVPLPFVTVGVSAHQGFPGCHQPSPMEEYGQGSDLLSALKQCGSQGEIRARLKDCESQGSKLPRGWKLAQVDREGKAWLWHESTRTVWSPCQRNCEESMGVDAAIQHCAKLRWGPHQFKLPKVSLLESVAGAAAPQAFGDGDRSYLSADRTFLLKRAQCVRVLDGKVTQTDGSLGGYFRCVIEIP